MSERRYARHFEDMTALFYRTALPHRPLRVTAAVTIFPTRHASLRARQRARKERSREVMLAASDDCRLRALTEGADAEYVLGRYH